MSGRDGLPGRLPLIAFPALLAVVLAILVGSGITGSSTGIVNQFFSDAPDSRLIAGTPQPIRSDEWLVQTPLVISQVQQDFPRYSQNLPGGTDSTVQSDLPSRDWSMAFRPHLLGFLFLSEASAMALRWWLPAFAMMAACYAFFLTLRPRSPFAAAAISIGFFFSPFFQWWYLPVTFWPVAWCFVVMTASVWLLRSSRTRAKIAWSALAGYLTVTTAVGVYVPFMVPSLLVAAAFVVGFSLTRSSSPLEGVLRRIRALLPLVIAGIVGTAVVGLWVATRWETITRFTGTVYPGQRLSHTGSITRDGILSLLAAPATRNLGNVTNSPLDTNASEASSFMLVGIFLIVPLAWYAWMTWRRTRTVDWLIVTLIVVSAVLIAYLIIPGWDPVAHLLLLDRSPAARMRLAFGILSIVFLAVLSARSPELQRQWGVREGRSVAIVTLAVAVIIQGTVILTLYRQGNSLVVESWTWFALSLGMVISVFLFARSWITAGALVLLGASLALSGGVNPLYRGVYDLNGTSLMRAMKALPEARTGSWVGVGHSYLPNLVLEESGLRSYNGFQSAPSPAMWHKVDPEDRYKNEWNRLASVNWFAGPGEPQVTNPQEDAIAVNFDSCSSFAQDNVRFVLSDYSLDQSCLELVEKVRQGPTEFSIYRVAGSSG